MKRHLILAVAMILCVGLCACTAVQPEEELYLEEIPVSAVPMRDTELYFADEYGYIVPVIGQIEWSDNMQKAALAALCGPAPEGLSALLPEGTECALYISGGTAVVDLPAQALKAENKKEEKAKLIAVVNTLAGFDNVDRVIVTVDGKSSAALEHGTDIGGTFVAFDINPQGEARDIGAVAYLPSENMSYIVPVTLYFEQQPQITDMVSSLASAEYKGLASALPEGTELADYNVDAAGTLTLAFNGKAELGKMEEISYKSLYLTCMEFDNVRDIDILVNGESVSDDFTLPTFANTF